ncbi:hypothetical protein AG1IA_09375 [Rhizoctonia solani AG-1 IA]|uniref:Uncharacterized protein n=1 Tax=Thanatephorus cucumeris (strain AG1-IA) TaxID=983506 RepID=L8WEH1_THACA|nr:hypothetical protein AG1IA_09375 [Rhizoctonia solani AG-1 IA]
MNQRLKLTPVCCRGAGSKMLGEDIWYDLIVMRIFRTSGVHRMPMTLGRARGVLPSARRAIRVRRILTKRFPKPEHSRALPGFWGPRRARRSPSRAM